MVYEQEQGNCLVPHNWENQQLTKWVSQQRTLEKKGKLAADKIKRLSELGFVWGADQQFWEDRYQELTTYRQEHGDCSVPYNWGNKQLAAWVRNQRTLKKGGKLYADKIKRLDELGFVWDAASPT